jgi:hypothetical protein
LSSFSSSSLLACFSLSSWYVTPTTPTRILKKAPKPEVQHSFPWVFGSYCFFQTTTNNPTKLDSPFSLGQSLNLSVENVTYLFPKTNTHLVLITKQQ